MLIRIGESPMKRAFSVLVFGWHVVLIMALYSTSVYLLYKVYHVDIMAIPATPVSILGVGLSIFLGFKNSASYDRWWEARKIWGAIVNESRTFGAAVRTLIQAPPKASESKAEKKARLAFQKEFVYRHIAWLNALRMHLRKETDWDALEPFLSEEELDYIKGVQNKPTQLNFIQAEKLQEAQEKGYLTDYRLIELMRLIQDFYTYQGKCERIKNTPFPRYYGYFTRVFLFFFVLLLPFVFLKPFGIVGIFLSIGITLVFWLIERSGLLSADPFENQFNDTPMTALCRTIEIDLREQLGETELPPPVQPIRGIVLM